MPEGPFVEAIGLRKTYKVGSASVNALDGLDLGLARGEMCALMGPSGHRQGDRDS